MEDLLLWHLPVPMPPIITKKYARGALEKFAFAGGYHEPESWIEAVNTTLKQSSREIYEESVLNAFAAETEMINQIVRQKVDMRSEKFYHKMRQAGRMAWKVYEYKTYKLLSDASQLMKPVKPGIALQAYRLVSPAVLRRTLQQMVRDYDVLAMVVIHCDAAGRWLKFKMNIGQRCGLALGLFALVARLSSLSLQMQKSLSSSYEKLSILVEGVTGDTGSSVTEGLRHVLKGQKVTKGSQKTAPEDSLLQSIFGDTGVGEASNAGSSGAALVPNREAEEGQTVNAIADDLDFGEVIPRSTTLDGDQLSKEENKNNELKNDSVCSSAAEIMEDLGVPIKRDDSSAAKRKATSISSHVENDDCSETKSMKPKKKKRKVITTVIDVSSALSNTVGVGNMLKNLDSLVHKKRHGRKLDTTDNPGKLIKKKTALFRSLSQLQIPQMLSSKVEKQNKKKKKQLKKSQSDILNSFS